MLQVVQREVKNISTITSFSQAVPVLIIFYYLSHIIMTIMTLLQQPINKWLSIVCFGSRMKMIASADLWKCAQVLSKQTLQKEAEVDICGGKPLSEGIRSLSCSVLAPWQMHCVRSDYICIPLTAGFWLKIILDTKCRWTKK